MTQGLIATLALLLATACLLPSASQAQTYYCDPTNQPVRIPQGFQSEVILVTRYPSSAYISSSMQCQFDIPAPPNGALYQVVIEQNPSLTPLSSRFKIREADTMRVLASNDGHSGSDNRVPLEQTVLVNRPGRPITVTLETPNFGVSIYQSAVQLRLRLFANCPPGWTNLGNYCVSQPTSSNGSSPTAGSSRQLDFATSQAACNAMRSNLLMMSFQGRSITTASLDQLFNTAMGYRYDAWIGLSRRSGSSSMSWLDGTPYWNSNAWNRCASNLFWSSSRCHDDELCAYYRVPDPNGGYYSGPVFDSCRYPSIARRFVCFMPTNGTDTFYQVPQMFVYRWILPTAVSLGIIFLVLFLACGSLIHRRRSRQLILLRSGTAAQAPPVTQFDAYGRPIVSGYFVGAQPYPSYQPGYQTFPSPAPYGNAQPVPPAYSAEHSQVNSGDRHLYEKK